MSKQEVYNILRSNPKKIFTIYDLKKLVNINLSTLCANLLKLRKDKLIKCKQEIVNSAYKKHYYWYE